MNENPIVLPAAPGPRTVLTDFVAATALAGCTSIADGHPSGVWAVVPAWPVAGFSTGEQALWTLLGSLAEGDLAAAFTLLDVSNRAAVVEVVAALAGPGLRVVR